MFQTTITATAHLSELKGGVLPWIPTEKLEPRWLSANPHPAAIAWLKRHPEYIDWSELSENPAEEAKELIEANLDKLDWDRVSRNSSEWAHQLLVSHPDKIEWAALAQWNTSSKTIKTLFCDLYPKKLTTHGCMLSRNSCDAALDILERNKEIKPHPWFLLDNRNPRVIPFICAELEKQASYFEEVPSDKPRPKGSEMREYREITTSAHGDDYWEELCANPLMTKWIDPKRTNYRCLARNSSDEAYAMYLDRAGNVDTKRVNWATLSENTNPKMIAMFELAEQEVEEKNKEKGGGKSVKEELGRKFSCVALCLNRSPAVLPFLKKHAEQLILWDQFSRNPNIFV